MSSLQLALCRNPILTIVQVLGTLCRYRMSLRFKQFVVYIVSLQHPLPGFKRKKMLDTALNCIPKRATVISMHWECWV